MKKVFTGSSAIISFAITSIPFLHKGTEAATSDIYTLNETIESMQNSIITMENQPNQTTTDNQDDKIIPRVPEPI